MIEYKVRVYPDGAEYWRLDGKQHRENGPAVTCANGDKFWFLNDERMTEEEHKAAMNPVEEMTMEEICKALGKNVKVIK